LANDDVLKSLLNSYNAAVREPNDELVHLYEIRDALVLKFGNQNTTKSALGISKEDWSCFGDVTNKASIQQGRHRGRSGGALRDATDDELFKARRIAGTMIEAYLRYLDETSDSSGQK